MNELKFAVECGFKLKVAILKNSDIQFSWGNQNVVILTPGEYVDMLDAKVFTMEDLVFTKQQTVEETVHPVKMTVEADSVVEIEKEYKATNKIENLTDKEYRVLMAIKDNTYEYGLPVDTELVVKDSGLSSHSVRGVISSLYKKGYVERYDFDRDMFTGKLMTLEYFLSEDILSEMSKDEG